MVDDVRLRLGIVIAPSRLSICRVEIFDLPKPKRCAAGRMNGGVARDPAIRHRETINSDVDDDWIEFDQRGAAGDPFRAAIQFPHGFYFRSTDS